MNRETIIQMAREAGAGVAVTMSGIAAAVFRGWALERFAALVAAKEREECAKVCEDLAVLIDLPSLYMGRPSNNAKRKAQQFADAIRARGEA